MNQQSTLIRVLSFSRLAPIIVFLALFPLGISAQDKQCTLKLADLTPAPELMGFRMGMTTDQVKARVPQVLYGKTDDLGVMKTSINPDFDSRIDKSTFPGVRTVSLDFLDGRVTSLWLGYDTTFKWSTIPDFVKGISQSLHVPDAWTTWRTRGQQLRCVDFQLTVIPMGEGPSFRIIDEAAEQTLTARREAKEAETSGAEDEQAEEVVADKKSQVYYPSGCQPEKEIKESDRIVFSSKEEAVKAGYKPAKNCTH